MPFSSLRCLLLAGAAIASSSSGLCQNPIVIATATEAAVRAAFVQANLRAFQVPPAPVTIQFASGLAGATVQLTSVLPTVFVDDLTIEVAGVAGTDQWVFFDATNVSGALRLSCSRFTCRNLAFANTGRSLAGVLDGVIAAGGSDLLFERCQFHNSTGIGLWAYGSKRVTARNCRFTNNGGPGMRCLDGADDVDVVDCLFQANSDAGLVLEAIARPRVRGSTFSSNQDGVLVLPIVTSLDFGPGNTVQNTTTGSGITIAGALDPFVHGSVFQDNAASGLAIKDLTLRARVVDNDFLRNGTATNAVQLSMEDSRYGTFTGNAVGNGFGDGILARRSSDVAIGRSPARAATFTGNRGKGLFLLDSRSVGATDVLVQGNLVAGGSNAQVQVSGCTAVDLLGVTVRAPAAASASTGITIAGGARITVGGGSLVEGHSVKGITVQGNGADLATDVVLGARDRGMATAGLTVRGNPGGGIQASDAVACRIVGGTAAAAGVVVENSGSATQPSLRLVGCEASEIGPAVLVDSDHVARIGVQFDTQCRGIRAVGLVVREHTDIGVVVSGGQDIELRDCTVEGGAGAMATGSGIDVVDVPGELVLLGCSIFRHGGDGLRISYSQGQPAPPRVLVAGCRIFDNRGDGLVCQRNGGTQPVVVVQSTSVVGRNDPASSGIRLLGVDGRVCNASVARFANGILLQGSAGQSTTVVVNTVSYGNTRDRFNPGGLPAAMSHSIAVPVTSGEPPGAWVDSNLLVADPLFVNAAAGDLAVQPGSPAIDTGLEATPSGVTLPAGDRDGLPRIDGGRVDRGCCEFAGGAANSLRLLGPWLRPVDRTRFDFRLDAGVANGNTLVNLALSGTGTGTSGTAIPLVPDAWSAVPVFVQLNAAGRGKYEVELPPMAMLLLPRELAFAFAVAPTSFVSNPVVVRFLP